MYASRAFMASESGSSFSPSFGFSMHQLIMSRSVENLLICSWNLGNSWGWLSEAKGWHMAHAMPVRESLVFIFFSVAASPWKSRSPILTCSINTSSKALSCSGVCLALCAVAGAALKTMNRASPRAAAGAASLNTVLFFMAHSSSTRIRRLLRCRLRTVGNAGAQNLVGVVSGARSDLGLGDYVLPPHHILIVHLVARRHGQLGPAHAVEVVSGIDAHHGRRERRHAFWRIGPCPGRGKHADGPHLADLIVEHLVGVAVDVRDLGVRLERFLHLPPVPHPEVPRRIVEIERVVAEHDHRLVLGPVGKGLAHPIELVPAHARPRPGHRTVQGRHVPHAFLGRHLLFRPVVRSAAHRIEPDDPDD